MTVEKLCSGCATSHPSKEHQAKLVPHGDPERTESKLNKGHWLEISYTWRCLDCGAIWENLVESGAGGHGNFWNRIDAPEQK
jgi:hypothetical protein